MSALPPLHAIRAFDAVAQTGSFTKAAAELNMTQAAISYQIKLLENFAGGALFTREARGVRLNDKGLQVAPLVRRALSEIAEGFRRLRADDENKLVISTMQTIASIWLAPRLGQFQLAHPELEVRLDITNRVVDLESEGVDVAIRSGNGNWQGAKSHFLISQRFSPMCSPHYIAREGMPKTPHDMLRHVLIARTDSWWPIWFKAAGLEAELAFERKSIDVETQQVAVTLAIAGSGIALLSPAFVGDDLAAGRLIQLFDVVASSGTDYYLAYAERNARKPKIRAFREWVLQQKNDAHGQSA